MINRATLIGNLGKAPEVRRLENGAMVAKFSVATTESYKDDKGKWQNQTEWHDIVVWKGGAEYAEKYLKKGSMVYIEGKITHRKYTDKDGIERYPTEIIANTCRLLEKKESSGGQAQTNTPSVSAPKGDVFAVATSAVLASGQKYRDRDGFYLTIVSIDGGEIQYQSTKVSGLHKISVDNWNKSVAPKYTLQEPAKEELLPTSDDSNNDLPF